MTRKFLELYKKSQNEKLTEIEKNRLKSLTERLQGLGPIQLELLANIRAFKDYFYNHLWELMNRFFVNRMRSKFFKHISQKYRELNKNVKKTGYFLVKNLILGVDFFEEDFIKEAKRFNLALNKQGKLRRTDGFISNRNYAKILGVSRTTISRWIERLNNRQTKILDYKTELKTVARLEKAMKYIESNIPSLHKFSEMMIYYLNHYKKSKLEFKKRLIFIFNKYSNNTMEFSQTSISLTLGKSPAYINDFKSDVIYEKVSKYFELLTLIHTKDHNDLGIPTQDDFNQFFQECTDLVFEVMVERDLIGEELKPHERSVTNRPNLKNGKKTFEVMLYILIALTQINRNKHLISSSETVLLTDLARIMSKQGRNYQLISNKLANKSSLNVVPCRRVQKLLREEFFHAPAECYLALVKISHLIQPSRYFGYNIHFKSLKPIQIKESINLTLGLNLFRLEDAEEIDDIFINDAKRKYKGFVMRVSRHHLDLDKGWFFMFAGDVIKLVPLEWDRHWKLHNDINNFKRHNELLRARMHHLIDIINRTDQNIETDMLIQKFKSKKIMVEGREINIWKGVNEQVFKFWIKRLKDFKSKGESYFYSKYYGTFFEFIFKPFMRDFNKYKEKLKSCKIPEFWHWYSVEYLPFLNGRLITVPF